MTVIRRCENDIKGRTMWLCKCQCGKEVIVQGYRLKKGTTRSCGCLNIELSTTHGLSKTRIYKILKGIKERCYHVNHKSYMDYGDRGITLCKEWHDPECFYQWSITHGYKENLTIDRINVNGNYEPSNCRWVTVQMQSINKRNIRYVEINGVVKTISEWCKDFNVNKNTVYSRLAKGMDIKEALMS